MFITPAFAQNAQGGAEFSFLIPLILMFAIMYFLFLRPQQKRIKEHREMVANVRRGDTVVTSGGLIGKVTKVDENELHIEVAQGVRVKVVRGTISEVAAKGQPVKGDKAPPTK